MGRIISNRIITLLGALLSFLIFTPSYSGIPESGALSLETATTESLEHSPDIQSARAQLEYTSWKRSEVFGAGFLPSLSITGARYLVTKYSTSIIPGFGVMPGFFPNTTLAADISIPIFNGFAGMASLRAARLEEQAAEKDLNRAEFKLKKGIQLAFYQALASSQLLSMSEENVKTLENHLKQVTIQKNGGSATQYDVLRVEVQLSDAKSDLIDGQDSVVLSRKKLTQLMGLDTDSRSLQGDLPTPDDSRIKELKKTDITEVRDDIQALNLRSEAASSMHSARHSWWFPSIALSGQYLIYDQQQVNFVTSSVINTGNFHTAYNVALLLKWNLFDGGVAIAKSQQASQQELIAQKSLESAKRSVNYDFDYWKRRYISNSDHYRSKTFDIKRSEESVRLAKEEQRAGSRTSSETLDAELDLFRARARAISSRLNAAEAHIQLELVLGKSI